MEKDSSFLDQIELHKDIPSVCAQKLMQDEVDIGLVPIAVYPLIPGAKIVSDYCIGAEGKVDTVILFSEVPLADIKSVYLDYQSRTSVQLCRTLFENHWRKEVQFMPAEAGYENEIGGNTAGLVIGDRAFALKEKYAFQYDLSEAWYDWKALPFVFATWVSNKEIPSSFLETFNTKLQWGVERIPEAITHFQYPKISKAAQLHYLTQSIQYPLDENKKEGIRQFLALLEKTELAL